MFRLVAAPTIFPSFTVTRKTVGPVVDTEVILQKGGRVYLTELEGWEVVNKFETFAEQVGMHATSFGWASPDGVAELQAQIAALQELLADAEKGQPKVIALEDAKALLLEPAAA